MLIISGAVAISAFRQDKALTRIQQVAPECHNISAHYVYFVDVEKSPDEPQTEVIYQLLNITDLAQQSPPPLDNVAFKRIVIPRFGTISPWATKATDIFHLCGLSQVRRVERGIKWEFSSAGASFDIEDEAQLAGIIFDPMTESMIEQEQQAQQLFTSSSPPPFVVIDLLNGGIEALRMANAAFGFALNEQEQLYLVDQFSKLGRNPTDVELMMFAQVNSEHCRHKIFNADWTIDNIERQQSLFSMIRHTYDLNSNGILSAYSDNAAALVGTMAERWAADTKTHCYGYQREPVHFTAKVETHNHPTAISPFPGAATGSGGEIRDEGAIGRGGKPKAGLVGYSVSHLRIPDLPQPWELPENKPSRIASPLQIMLEGPIGAASFNNEFGRPNIAGYFRSFEYGDSGSNTRVGYHKPIMLAGGLGNVRPSHIKKNKIPDKTPIVVLGGPTMLIGLGGGAASSVASGSSTESLDFASVQRGNPEMQRRCQEVIDACCAMGEENPILSIHDVGAGGLCNALPELVHDSDAGGEFELRKVLNDEPGMSPMQIWCNESQERYVLAIDRDKFDLFEALCARERCLYAEVGMATQDLQLVLHDEFFDKDDKDQKPIDLPMDVLFGLPPKMHRNTVIQARQFPVFDYGDVDIDQAINRVLAFPTVGDKTFLITIGDRSVTGLIARDQMVGPWQVPVADAAVTASGYRDTCGEAFAIGERTPIAMIDAPASGRMAIGEVVTNLAAASIDDISKIKLSANWMVAAGEDGHEADLYATVAAIALDLCPALGMTIPVGKDSMSMKTVWASQNKQQNKQQNKVVSPLSLVVSGFAGVSDVRTTLTPVMQDIDQPSDLWLLDLSDGKNRLGASVLAQAYGEIGKNPADLDRAANLKQFFALVQKLKQEQLIMAYHDRSDGGLITTLCEMAFASRCGLKINLDELGGDPTSLLFSEELGAVMQARRSDRERIQTLVASRGLGAMSHLMGHPVIGDRIQISVDGEPVLSRNRSELHKIWSMTSWRMQRMRDNPDCADQEYQRIVDHDDTGLFCDLSYQHNRAISDEIFSSASVVTTRPKIAILREQGVNGQLEMAAAFHSVGFETVDVTTTDLVNGVALDDFKGLAACGGFSFGDVLGAGEGWGKSILFNSELKDKFAGFFNRSDTFALGVCNGCQMLSSIKQIIPGASSWPRFMRNRSEQYEARFVMVEVTGEKSIFFNDMSGSKLPVSTAHGEGRAKFESPLLIKALGDQEELCLRFIDNQGAPTETYPYNPNGTVSGLTGFTNSDGRFTIMMPHPERVFRTLSNSWHPDGWGEYSPWIKIFENARNWVN